jgi:phenylacetate-CoA ligase
VLTVAGLAPYYQLEVSRDAQLDQLTVRVECQPEVAGDGPGRARLAGELQAGIKAAIGVSSVVTVCEPGTLERSAGKASHVIDRRSS